MSLPNPETVVTEERLNEFYTELLPYLGGRADAGFTPVGTIIAVMGTTAPTNYLACNGQTVNIADYPELAAYFKEQFGSANYFGGDGTTTFKICDLRGEFLRGTGTNSHTNQGDGAAVGTHQDATNHPLMGVQGITSTGSGGQLNMRVINGRDNGWPSAADKEYALGSGTVKNARYSGTVTLNDTGGTANYYSSRPTNTSVLYCIATKNIYLNPENDYSTDEKVVGTWIDGKPVYQKTFEGRTSASGTSLNVAHNISNIDKLVSMNGSLMSGEDSIKQSMPLGWCTSGNEQAFRAFIYNTNLAIRWGTTEYCDKPYIITVQYTKTTD